MGFIKTNRLKAARLNKQDAQSTLGRLLASGSVALKSAVPLMGRLVHPDKEPKQANDLIRKRLEYHQAKGSLAQGGEIPSSELAAWIFKQDGWGALQAVPEILALQATVVALTGNETKAVIGQVRVVVDPEPQTFDEVFKAYVEKDFEVHRLQVENSDLRRRLQIAELQLERRNRANRENAQKIRGKRN